ncbi:invasion associated locus B family protein [uncultured Paracoccus sp.]|uniref:invasion associated locus B family protein n=1 Tax=uncultured Paracoccus sp. TaxID=189685 RepID=UPI002613ED00|nr:invasion associated locus B family protein [uncultured Paracoccus sp.]
MAYKSSSALLAAILLMAGPALAQEAAPTTQPETAESATPEAAAPAADAAATAEAPAAADQAEAAVDGATAEATEAATEATTEAPAADAAAAPAADAATAPVDAAAAPAEAPAADTASTEPQVGAYYLKATHGDWTIRCIKAQEGQPDPCELYQLLKDGEGNSVAEVTMIPLSQGEAAAGATIVAPLETDLIRGLGLKIDSAAPRGYPFNFCAPVGCVSRMGFDAAGLNGLKRGNSATVSLLPFAGDPENPVELPMSLAGFTAAFTELEGIAKEAQEQLAAQAEAAPAAEAPTDGEAAPAN